MSVVDAALLNAASACALGACVLAVTRFARRPEIAHLLWLLVLLELLTPPLFGIRLLPAGPAAAPPAAPVVSPGPTGPDLSGLALGAWIVGIAAILGLAAFRSARFSRGLSSGRIARGDLAGRVAELSRKVGVRRSPRLWIVDADLPPFVRLRLGRPEIVFPEGLLTRLSEGERDGVILHELAHLRRRDPVVRFVELLATAAFWWNPLVYFARRRLRRAEEACCDSWVVRAVPTLAVDYARALVKTAEFLSGRSERLPALASGAGDFRDMEERLTMILEERPPKRVPRLVRVAVGVLAAALLLCFPSRGDEPEKKAPAPQSTQAQLRELEQRVAELEARLAEERAGRPADVQARELAAMQQDLAREAEEHARAAAERALTLDQQREKVRQGEIAKVQLELAREAEGKATVDSRRALEMQATRLREALAEIERELAKVPEKGEPE